MATMLKLKKQESENMTPEMIQGKLFYFADAAHKLHLDTKSYEIHIALDGFYKSLVDFRDEISEKLMGYLGGKRIGEITIDPMPEYSNAAVLNLTEQVKDFAYALYEWAGEKKYCDIENIAQSLSGTAAKTTYLLTLT